VTIPITNAKRGSGRFRSGANQPRASSFAYNGAKRS
jgi:hypothetical protein